MKFKRGDVVQLKSGGPLMTVEHCEFEDVVECTWFDDRQHRKGDKFHEYLLQEASDEPLGPVIA